MPMNWKPIWNLGDRILISGFMVAMKEPKLSTDIDEESRRPENQTGTGYGAGLISIWI